MQSATLYCRDDTRNYDGATSYLIDISLVDETVVEDTNNASPKQNTIDVALRPWTRQSSAAKDETTMVPQTDPDTSESIRRSANVNKPDHRIQKYYLKFHCQKCPNADKQFQPQHASREAGLQDHATTPIILAEMTMVETKHDLLQHVTGHIHIEGHTN